jgi:NACalpha-BTF3-like transcription factor
MVEEQAQAKQLDSVTDVVQEQEVDAARAEQAMSALAPNSQASGMTAAEQAVAHAVHREDVDLIVHELEVTEELARKTLLEVAVELGITQRDGDALVVAALRKLVTS